MNGLHISADREGNLYTGPNTEDTPTVVEATAFKDGVVIAQVNGIVDRVPRVDIPGDCVHFVIEAGKPFFVEPLFTRDPAAITEGQILTAMLMKTIDRVELLDARQFLPEPVLLS